VKQEKGTINSGAAVGLTATSTNDAKVIDVSIEVSALKLKSIAPEVVTGGSTKVHVGGNYTFNSPGVTGQATATNQPNSQSFHLGGAYVGITTVRPKVSATHETEAFVGREADVAVNGGSLTLSATSTNDVKAEKFGLSLGLINVDAFNPTVEAAGATRAYAAEGASGAAAGLGLTAPGTNPATVDLSAISIGAGTLSILAPTVKTSHVAEAYLGPRAGIDPSATSSGTINLGGGTLTVSATSHDKA